MSEYAKKIMAENPSESRHPYSAVPESHFHLLQSLPVSLYLKIGDEFVELVSKFDNDRKDLVQHLFDRKIRTVYVHLSDRKVLFRETEKHLNSIIADPKIPFEHKASALNSASMSIIEDIFEDPDNTERVKATRPLVENQITLFQNHPRAFLFMSNLGAHDYYSYTHSIGVASYALAYCIHNKCYQGDELTEAGQAALLHDVGKAKIAWNIINKNGQLSDAEWNEMKQHPTLGYDILKNSGITSPIILQVARNHHENLDGTGYPDGLFDSDIMDITQVVCLSDVFSALTTNRSYSNARSAYDAFKFMTEKMKGKFRTHIFKNFLTMFRPD